MNELLTLAIFFIAFGVADGVGIAWDYVKRAAASVTNIGITTADREAIADRQFAGGMTFELSPHLLYGIATGDDVK